MLRLGRKSQVAVETLIVISVLALISLAVSSIYMQREENIGWSDDFLNAKRECYIVSSLINRVRANGKDFNEVISLQKGHRVKVFGDDHGIEVWWDGDYVFCTHSTTNVTNGTDSTFEFLADYKVFNDGVNVVFKKI